MQDFFQHLLTIKLVRLDYKSYDLPVAAPDSLKRLSKEVDADGILHVSAKDVQSGKQQKIRIEAKSGLSENEIKRMLKDAEEHAEEDKQKKEGVEAKNEGDSLAFRAQKALDEHKDRVPQDVKDTVQSKIDALKKALEGTDVEAIKTATAELNTHMQKIGESMQKQGGGAAAGQSSNVHNTTMDALKKNRKASENKNSDIEEAEVEIIDEEKK